MRVRQVMGNRPGEPDKSAELATRVKYECDSTHQTYTWNSKIANERINK